ncbi:MAG: fibronectin type 3 domain-containing protein [Sulfurimonas sp.]|jgi:fibronectin type 3 domain-containing protein
MKLWKLATFCAASLLILSGCGGTTPKPSNEIKIDKTLPIVKLTENGTVIDMNAIAFEWEAIEDERVNGIYIYKQTMDGILSYYKTIENRFTSHFLDSNIKPDTRYTYSFKTFSAQAESKMSKIEVINSLPVLQSVVWIRSMQNMPRTAKIIWRPHSNQKVKSYIIERRTLEENEWKEIARINGRLNAEFIDIDLKDDFVYKYRVRVLTYDDILSIPSQIVQVVTKALPISIKHIVATNELPRKIEINWEKSTTEDFARYYLYRAESSNGTYELIAKLYNNNYTDIINEDGKEYFYRVSAVEKNGLESIHDKLSIQGLTLIKPKTPSLVDAKLVGNKIVLNWTNKDTRVKSFTVIKKTKNGWFDAKDEEFVSISGTKFVDPEIGPNITYFYKVFAVDEFFIKSEGSIEVEIKTPNTVSDNTKKEKTKEVFDKPLNKKVEVIVPTQDFN